MSDSDQTIEIIVRGVYPFESEKNKRKALRQALLDLVRIERQCIWQAFESDWQRVEDCLR